MGSPPPQIVPAVAPADDSPFGVSFVIPVFNKARQLPPVLDALKAQSGDFAREYVFVDDGSTDDSVAVVEAATADWTNATLIRQANGGSANATNTGLAHARLPFVKFLDADDLLAVDATAHLLAALSARPDAAVAFADRTFFKPGATPDLAPTPTPPTVREIADPLTPALSKSMFNPTQFLSRTDLCRAVGGCDDRVRFSQEYTLTLRLARHGPFLHLDRTLAYLLDDSENRLSNNEGRQLQRVTMALRYFLDDYPDLPHRYRWLACRRAAGRAARFARRHKGAPPVGPHLWRSWRARFGVVGDPVAFIRACEAIYD